MKKLLIPSIIALSGLITMQQAMGAIALDRTRIIYNGTEKSVSLNISNENQQLPYLAQGWLENAQGIKVTSPLIILPPVQRVEPGAKSAIKVQALPAVNMLPQDRESLFYFNLREIPPRSEKANVLQIALQTRIKLFYRPKGIIPSQADIATPWQEKLILKRQGDSYQVLNPTPYYVTIVNAAASKNGSSVANFKPVMIEPLASATLSGSASALGHAPVVTYVNDYGGRPALQFSCAGDTCTATAVKAD
jgi:P pilus assembly chaperone PapD